MAKLAHARSFRDLVVYQKSREAAKDIFTITKDFPPEEKYALTDQVRRSSRSIGAQIAEAWAKRRYEKHFVSKLTDGDGEQQETQHWVECAFDCEYIASEQRDALIACLSEIGRMLDAMMRKVHLFCATPPAMVREDTSEYFTDH